LHLRAATAAAFARLGDRLALASARRTRRLNAEEALAPSHLPDAAAGLASRLAAGLGARAFALVALAGALELDLLLDAEDGLLEVDREIVAQVCATPSARASAAARAPAE